MRKIRYLQAVAEGLRQEMEKYPAVFVMGEDVRQGSIQTTPIPISCMEGSRLSYRQRPMEVGSVICRINEETHN